MKKIVKYSIIICFIFIPMAVKANIVCNDGTVSSSCGECHRGCCSRHGGCTDNPNYADSNSSSYGEIQNSESLNQETESSQYSTTESEMEQQKSVESVPNHQQEENVDKIKDEADEYNLGKKDESESTEELVGLAVLGVIGAVIYNTKKKKK